MVIDENSNTIMTNGGGSGKQQGSIYQKWLDLQGTKEGATAAVDATSIDEIGNNFFNLYSSLKTIDI